ncbi:MAG: RNA-protein complex protein Nop10 [Candidatus Methanofastidiosia archaeon]
MRICKCKRCEKYTISEVCPYCGGEVFPAKPPRYSPEDRFAKYRRMWKKQLEEM